MSRAASAFAWPLTDVHDALSGFFAVRRELLAEIPPDAAGFKIALEILVRGGDSLRVGEVPIAFRDRELGQSKMGTGVILTYFRRLLALSGWRESRDSVRLGMAKTALVWAVDFAVFAAAWAMGARLGAANLLGFASGAMLNAWLKAAQLPREPRRIAPLLSRLLFVSLLSLFLRSGVLGTFARYFGWAGLAAIVPAIVTGWTVLFLGYALFIWPVRDQYGSGVRWRVAAMGATAYLLALRVAYLYAMPVDTRLASMPDGASGMSAGDRLTVALRHLGTMLLGSDSAGFNVGALLCWVVGAWAVFQCTQRVLDKTTAFRALLLFSVLPVYFWTGAVFSPATVLISAWAILIWLMTFALRREQRIWGAVCGIAVVIFWWPAGPLPAWPVEIGMPAIMRQLLFIVLQPVLVTPVALIALWQHFARGRGGEVRLASVAAAVCAGVAAMSILQNYLRGTMGISASGAIWLPLLPLIAEEMQKTGSRPARWWGPVIYACIIIYGLYFYWLAFPG
jgi:dolichol-phosphate mannosyltransferase